MKTLIIDVYRFVYLISGAKMLSVAVGVVYVTILNMIMLCGLGLLMEGWMPTKFVSHLFVFPYYFFTAALVLLFTARYKPSKKVIAKEAKKTNDYTFIIVYSIAAIIMVLYMRYGAKINFNERKKMAYCESVLHREKVNVCKNQGIITHKLEANIL